MAQQASVYASDHSPAVLSTHSWRTAANSIPYLLRHLHPDMHILDIGCGPGTITVDLAKRVRRGHVTGLEYVAEPLEAARAFAEKEKVKNVDFQVGDIHSLPFPDGTFDIVHCHQVLQHIRDPILGLREMKRVAKPGGLVAARESMSFSWYPALPGLDLWYDLWKRVAWSIGGNPNPGARLHAWAREAGFEKQSIQCSTGSWCYSTKEEREWWGGVWVDRVKGKWGDLVKEMDGEEKGAGEVKAVEEAWKEWGESEDGLFAILHGDILCRVSRI